MMQHTYAYLDAVPALVFLLAVLGLVAAIWLAERICGAVSIKRHRYDGLRDVRDLRALRQRTEAKRASAARR